MSNEIYGRIYLITNLVNGKRYVGQTTQTVEERFIGHIKDSKYKNNMPIGRAIKKYGPQNFNYEEICLAYSPQELNMLEGSYINKFDTANRKTGYNIQIVNINGKYNLSEETKQKISKKHRGKSKSNSSKYVGIHFFRQKYWSAYVCKNSKQIRIGIYTSEIEAAQARDIEELKIMGNEAILNFPELRNDYLSGKIKIYKRTKHKQSNSTVVGVSYKASTNKWRFVRVGFKEKQFNTKEEAELYAVYICNSSSNNI